MLKALWRIIANPSRISRNRSSALWLVAMCALFTGFTPHEAQAAGALDLSAYKGKVVYLDFWASWCGACKQSFPYMMSLERRYGPEGLVVIAVNLDKDRAKAQAFLDQTGSTLPIVYDPAGDLPATYKVKDMPTSVLIGRQGQVRFTHKGFFPKDEATYEQHIAELIDEK